MRRLEDTANFNKFNKTIWCCDLKCLKETSAVPSHLPLTSIFSWAIIGGTHFCCDGHKTPAHSADSNRNAKGQERYDDWTSKTILRTGRTELSGDWTSKELNVFERKCFNEKAMRLFRTNRNGIVTKREGRERDGWEHRTWMCENIGRDTVKR